MAVGLLFVSRPFLVFLGILWFGCKQNEHGFCCDHAVREKEIEHVPPVMDENGCDSRFESMIGIVFAFSASNNFKQFRFERS